jgi:hypothetical protein
VVLVFTNAFVCVHSSIVVIVCECVRILNDSALSLEVFHQIIVSTFLCILYLLDVNLSVCQMLVVILISWKFESVIRSFHVCRWMDGWSNFNRGPVALQICLKISEKCVWNVMKYTTKHKHQETNNPFQPSWFSLKKMYSLRVHLTDKHSEILGLIQMCNQLSNFFLPFCYFLFYFTSVMNHIKTKNPCSSCDR